MARAHPECARCGSATRPARMDDDPLALDVCLNCHVIVGTRNLPTAPVVETDEDEERLRLGYAGYKSCPSCDD